MLHQRSYNPTSLRRRTLHEDKFDLHMPMLAGRAVDLEYPLEWAQVLYFYRGWRDCLGLRTRTHPASALVRAMEVYYSALMRIGFTAASILPFRFSVFNEYTASDLGGAYMLLGLSFVATWPIDSGGMRISAIDAGIGGFGHMTGTSSSFASMCMCLTRGTISPSSSHD